MAVPVLQAHTMRRGEFTKSGWASVLLDQFMLVSGSPIISWSITLTGGTAGHWNLPTTGGCPTPTATGDTANLNGGPYTFNVTATNADGTSAAAVLTINIVSNTYTISTRTEGRTSISTGTDGGVAIKTVLGGRTIALALGHAVPLTSDFTFRGLDVHSPACTITSEFPDGTRTTLPQIVFQGCANITTEKLEFELYLDPSNVDDNAQNRGMLFCDYNATFPTLFQNMVFQDLDCGAPAGTLLNQWCSLIVVEGNGLNQAGPITLTNVRAYRIKDGIRLTSVKDSSFTDYSINRFCGNAHFNVGALSNNLFEDGTIIGAYINPINPSDHRDFHQQGGPVGGAIISDTTDTTYRRMLYIKGDGNGYAQGIFFNDVGYYSPTGGLTGKYQNNVTAENCFCDSAAQQGLVFDAGFGWTARRNTAIRGPDPDSDLWLTPNYIMSGGVPNTAAYWTGTVTNNVFNRNGMTALITSADNKVLNDIVGQPSGWSSQTYNNATETNTYNANFFQDPDRVIDYENGTVAQIIADIKAAYSPIESGSLMNVDGTYAGAFFPDGTFNDGSVYQLTPPTSYTITPNDTEVLVGESVQVTIQLDAAANVEIDFTPTLSGVTGSFSPALPSIPIGQASVVTTFTPTSAGTATIGMENGGGLPEPSTFQVTVNSPASGPTTYTQAASPSPYSPFPAGITLTYTLDAPAVATVTITPACTLAGSFVSGSTVTITSGNSTGTATFAPTTTGTATFSATNGNGLANPANIAVEVTTCTTGQLVKLGIR